MSPGGFWQRSGEVRQLAQENLAQNRDSRMACKRGSRRAAVDFRLGWNPTNLYQPRKAWASEILRDDNAEGLWFRRDLSSRTSSGGNEPIRFAVGKESALLRHPRSSMATMVIIYLGGHL